ncbi:uncharacterized protein JN550_002486 [Neoarthrinium moseri]|uniref:uncharacterized protein n=1 Tax=Neoarthrinium moseri TaxID=1658444 RepID=UPI001FDB8604|nr:uncharacterized protein JN550_002486 [Neoarthrinium moseri]KAI1875057.1 hypothetical protein JN550_002486 [Neoarthrinium moseri]
MEWIVAPDGFDAQCKSELNHLVQKARHNELDDWSSSPEGSLAQDDLLDQLPRKIHRSSSDALTDDERAWGIATKAIAGDYDKQVTVIPASEFYMPLMQQ